jgi:hypothetical protein
VPAVRALLDALTSGTGDAGGGGAAVRLAGARSWRGLPALYREHAVFVTASDGQAREQLACGARVVGPLASGMSADAVRDQVEAARAAGPLGRTEIRAALRDVFAEHATPARLAAVVRAAGLPAVLAGGRQIAVLASVADAAQAGRLAAALLSQRLRPAEVVVAAGAADAGGAVRDALAPLADHGIRVVTTSGSGSGAGPDWPRPLARLATAPWVAPWVAPSGADGSPPDTYLLDLACARECAQADAVGFGADEYEFTRWLDEPALARRGLLAPDGPPAADWGSHGLRLFTITR